MNFVPVFRASLIALALAALPAGAQPAPQPGAMPGMGGAGQSFAHGGLLRDLSPAGRMVVRQALRSVGADGTHQQIEAIRAQMLDLIAADPLDAGALGRAMLAERNLALGQQARTQAAMLGAFQQLSLADRRAFVATAREVQARVEERRAAQRGSAKTGGQGLRGWQ